MRIATRLRALVVLVVFAVLAAGCGDDGGSSSEPTGSSPGGSTSAPAGEPVAGGTLTFASYLRPTGFDPTMVNSTYGCCGGSELAALYDVLLSVDPDTGEYTGRVAESFTPNADYTSWTLKLREGVKFSDGTDYDAEAVKFNIERHLAPTSRSAARAMLTRFLGEMTVIDPLTLEIDLKEAWTGFPTLLAREVGMVASPTAIAEAGENFALNPGNAGAGPFLLQSFKPDEPIVFVKNPDYWGGEVYLDSLRFVSLGSEQTSFEALKAGQVDAVFLRNPQLIAAARDEGREIITAGRDPMGLGLIFNAGVTVTCQGGEPAAHCAGKADGTTVTARPPTADVRVRRAVAMALDPEVLNERVYKGTADMTTEYFPEPLPWSPGVPGISYDPDEARRLVEAAKADGWDGKIRLRVPSTSADFGITAMTLLEQVGFDVDLNANEDVAAQIAAVLTTRDYEISNWALGFSDDINNIYAQLAVSFQGSPTRYGYSSPELDAALEALQVADDTDARRSAVGDIATVLNRDVPFVSLSLGEQVLVVNPKLKGLELDGQERFNFDKAWFQP